MKDGETGVYVNEQMLKHAASKIRNMLLFTCLEQNPVVLPLQCTLGVIILKMGYCQSFPNFPVVAFSPHLWWQKIWNHKSPLIRFQQCIYVHAWEMHPSTVQLCYIGAHKTHRHIFLCCVWVCVHMPVYTTTFTCSTHSVAGSSLSEVPSLLQSYACWKPAMATQASWLATLSTSDTGHEHQNCK